MSKSISIGPVRLRPHQRDGKLTGQWLADIRPSLAGGKRVRRFFDNRKEAESFAKDFDREYRGGRLHAQANIAGSSFRFAQVVEEWVEAEKMRVQARKKRSISLSTDRYRLKPLIAMFGDKSLDSITEEAVTTYQACRLRDNLKPETINSDVRTLRKVLRWAHRKGWLYKLPTLEFIPVQPSMQDVPTSGEVVRIIDQLPSRLKPLVRFIAETGCRSGEAFNLTWDCVDEFNGIVEFSPKDGWTPKTSQSYRSVYVTGDLLDEIRNLPKSGKYVFPGKVADVPIDNIRKAFATAVKKAEITRNGQPLRVTPQTLRKAYATWLAMRNVPQRVLQENLGHAPGSTVTNRYYVQASEEERRKAVVELPMSRTNTGQPAS